MEEEDNAEELPDDVEVADADTSEVFTDDGAFQPEADELEELEEACHPGVDELEGACQPGMEDEVLDATQGAPHPVEVLVVEFVEFHPTGETVPFEGTYSSVETLEQAMATESTKRHSVSFAKRETKARVAP